MIGRVRPGGVGLPTEIMAVSFFSLPLFWSRVHLEGSVFWLPRSASVVLAMLHFFYARILKGLRTGVGIEASVCKPSA